MESNVTQHEFFARTYGFGGKFWKWFGMGIAVIGLLIAIFNSSGRAGGIKTMVTGLIIAAVARSHKYPLVILTPETFSIKMGLGKKYRVISKAEIVRVEMADKKITVVPKQGRAIALTQRIFKKESWAQMQGPFQEFARGIQTQ